MRLLHLDIERYGAFTGRRISFRPDAALHIVLGPNEAGKSTALAAITDLLFGIEERTRHAFLHGPQELRLGADIVARDGRQLSFRRRKGRKRTLLDAADGELPDDALGPFLGGLTRDVFGRAFGLDAAALREGGSEMLTSDGEVGAALFAAASGLRGYSGLRDVFESEADRIFAPRASKDRAFYQALTRFQEANSETRNTRLGSDAWADLNARIATSAERLEAIGERRGAIAAAKAGLERLNRVSPSLAAIDLLTVELARFDGLIEMADEAVDELARVREEAQLAEAARTEAERQLHAAEADLGEVPESEGLSAQAQAIATANQGISGYRTAQRDLPRVTAEADELTSALEQLARRVGLPDIAVLTDAQPTDAARKRVELLVRAGREVAGDAGRLRREQAARQAALRKLEVARAERGGLVDPAPLRQAYEALEPLLRHLGRCDDMLGDLLREEAALGAAVRRLSPPVPGLAALAAAALPGRDTLQRFSENFDATSHAEARQRDRLERLRKSERDIAAALRDREAGRPVPEAADLAAERNRRDAAWQRLRAGLFGEAAIPAGAALASEVSGFEQATHMADRMADELASDAGRAAEQAADRRHLNDASQEAAQAQAALVALAEDKAALDAQWTGLWAGLCPQPLPPREMQLWLVSASGLIERHGELEASRVDHQQLVARVETARAPLLALARRLGLAELVTGEREGDRAIGVLSEQVSDAIRALDGTWQAARESETRLIAAREALEAGEQDVQAATAALAQWRGQWRAALDAIGLDNVGRRTGAASDTDAADDLIGIEEAEAALAAWREVPGALGERDNRLRRINGMRRDIEAFEQDVAHLVQLLAPELQLGPAEAAKALHERLASSVADDARRIELARRRQQAARAAAEAMAAAALASERLDETLIAARIGPEHDLGALLVQLDQRREVRSALQARRAELAAASDRVDEAVLRAGLLEVSADDIAARLVRLTEEDGHLDQESKEVFAERSRLQQQREAISGGMGAEVAAAQRSSAQAELRDSARRYVVLKLGALLLGTAIDKHRGAQHDPMVRRAGELFSKLTGGAFAGLVQSYDSNDSPVLAGLRGGVQTGAGVPVEGMSEGTRDQLYLALRLAYLEDYGRNAEAAPLIGDDIFASFDDARTGHGLETLAAVGASVQPILLTHHTHVADIARARLGNAVDVVEL